MDGGTLGEIRGFAGNFVPRNWAFCSGQILAINSNQSLFSILGAVYGGDGRSTFGLPDLRGRAIVGAGQGNGLHNRPLGSTTGHETHTLSVSEMPAHTHVATATSASGSGTTSGDIKIPVLDGDANDDGASGNFLAKDANNEGRYASSATPGTYLGALESSLAVDLTAINVDVTLLNTGSEQSFNKMKPMLVCNYIICTAGLYPSRN